MNAGRDPREADRLTAGGRPAPGDAPSTGFRDAAVPAASPPSGRWQALLIVACAILPFAAVAPREFTNWDDQLHVARNGAVQYPTPTNLGLLCREPVAGNLVPLTMLSYAADWQIWNGAAWGFGVTNAVLYAACCLLLVRWLRVSGVSAGTAWLAGLVFAVHPLHVEPAAWISGRKDLLCLVWLVAAHIAFGRWLTTNSRWSYAASLLFLIAAGLSKPAAMSAFASLWLYGVLVAGRRPLPMLKSVLPHTAVCLLVLAVAVWAQGTGQAFRGADDPRWGDPARAGLKIVVDLTRCFVPVPYCPFYPPDLLDIVPVPARWLALFALVAVSAALALYHQRALRRTEFHSVHATPRGGAPSDSPQPRTQRIAAVTYGWFAASCFLLPVSGIVPLGWTSIADRYLLVPSIGSCLVVAWAVRAMGRPAVTASAYGLAVCLALPVHVRATEWSDSVNLWQAVLRRFPDTPLAWKNLTAAHYQRGDVSTAARVALDALQTVPADPGLTRNAAEILLEQGRPDEAAALIARARAAHPQTTELAVPAAKLALRHNQPGRARALLEPLLNEPPGPAEPWLVLSYVAAAEGDTESAVAAAAKAVSLAPSDAEVHRRLIALHLENGDRAAALEAAVQATRAVPHAREAWRLRCDLLRLIGRPDAAAQVASESARFIPPPL